MKKLLLMAGIAVSLSACNNDNANGTSAETDSSSHEANSPTYKASDGDVSYRNGKVVIWRDNEWVEADDDVTLENGVVVRRNGEVEKDGKIIVLEEGEIVDRTGRFFDKAGNAIENAWDDVKQGVKKGVNEVDEEVKDIFDDDDNKNN